MALCGFQSICSLKYAKHFIFVNGENNYRGQHVEVAWEFFHLFPVVIEITGHLQTAAHGNVSSVNYFLCLII